MEVKSGYKKTEVGVIPEEWRISRFGDLCSATRGGSPRPIQDYITDSPDGVNWIKIRDIGVGAKYIDSTAEKIIAAGVSRSRHVRVGDFLLSNSMSFGRPYILRTEGCIHDGWLVIQGYQRAFDTEYLYYYLSSEAVVAQYTRYAAGSSVLNLNKEVVSSICVAAPPTAEQRAIAAALADVDALLAKLDQLIAKKRDLKQAVMQQLLTGRRRLPGFKGVWTTARIEELVDVDPSALPANTASDFPFNYISLEDVDRGALNGWSEQIFATAPSRARRLLKTEDVLVSTVRPNLQSHLLFSGGHGVWVCSTGFAVLRARRGKASSRFLFECMFSEVVTRQIEAVLTGSNYPAINSRDVRCLVVPAPEYGEQVAIAAVLADMSAELAALEARRDKTRQLKQGMMQALLTGRIRLT